MDGKIYSLVICIAVRLVSNQLVSKLFDLRQNLLGFMVSETQLNQVIE